MSKQIAILGRKFYDEHLKQILEPEHIGDFVTIEPESGQYFLGKTGGEAINKGNVALPNKMLFLVRIGFPFTYKMGFRGSFLLKKK